MQLIAPYLDEMIALNASDLFLNVGSPPSMRVNGIVNAMNAPVLADEDMALLVGAVLNEQQQQEFASSMELNVAVKHSTARFRLNVYSQLQHTAIVIRMIKDQVPTVEDLNLPDIFKTIIESKRGLVLMVGATGSGKSTSMAAMINHRNHHASGHIITIEDPIEYIHTPDKCIISQREIGMDTYSYGMSLKNALRQSPDLLVIGEIRDRETLESAIGFCETGHLVMATLHASNANQAIERIASMFPEESQKQILMSLAQNLKAIISQRLVTGLQKERVLAHEVMLNEGLITQLVEDYKINEIKDVMDRNQDMGMITFDNCLYNLFINGDVSHEAALEQADSPSNLRLKMNSEKMRVSLKNEG